LIKDGKARQAGGIPFEDKMADMTAELKSQMKREEQMNENIKVQLEKIGFSL